MSKIVKMPDKYGMRCIVVLCDVCGEPAREIMLGGEAQESLVPIDDTICFDCFCKQEAKNESD